MNLSEAPGTDLVEKGAVRPVSLLSETGASATPEDFLTELAAAYARYESQFCTYGFEPIRTAWLERAANIGQMITARTYRDEYMGRFNSVDQSGHLILDTTDGRRAIAAADIYF